MRSLVFVLISAILATLVAQTNADLLPVVSAAESNCSGNGAYDNAYGLCRCNWPYSGRICQYKAVQDSCMSSYDCYNCQDYTCPKYGQGYFISNIWTCDAASTEYDSERHKTVPVTVHSNCRNVSSICFEVYECECPSGIAFLGSSCFKEDLIHSIGFFMLIMAALTVFSTVFEIGIHKLEHHLEYKNQKAILGIIQTFKSELTLIGLIGLTLYLVSSSDTFEHGIQAVGGKEEIIEAIHFLIFFLVIGYFFTLAICLICSKLYLSRKLRKHEEVFQMARQAAFRGEIYEEVKQDLVIQKKLNGFFSATSYREYNAYRIYFMKSLKNEYREEDLMFFRFDEYLMICVNDLIGQISGGTWLAWIFFAWNFFADVYMDNWLTYVSKFLFIFSLVVANTANNGLRDGVFHTLREKQSDNQQIQHDQELQPIVSANDHHNRRSKSSISPIIVINQSMIWFGLTHLFTSVFAARSVQWYILLIGFFFMFIVYGFIVMSSLQTIAGAVFNGSLINKQYVTEVMKRHPQVDKQVLIEQYRDKNNGELPAINDVLIGLYDK